MKKALFYLVIAIMLIGFLFPIFWVYVTSFKAPDDILKPEKLIVEAGKSEKSKVAKKTTAKSVKAKTTKRAPAKKAPAKKGPAQL